MSEKNFYTSKEGFAVSEGQMKWQEDAERILAESKKSGKIPADWTPEQDRQFIEEYVTKISGIIKTIGEAASIAAAEKKKPKNKNQTPNNFGDRPK